MKYNFDIFGWYTTEDNGRETSHEPPTLSETIVPGALRANYTGIPGKEWLLLPYSIPVPTPTPEPTPIVPEQITPRQGYIVLSRYGLLAPVKAYFAALEGQEGEEAQIELEFAQEWKRSWPTLINAAHAFGLTDAQIDQMFIEASVI